MPNKPSKPKPSKPISNIGKIVKGNGNLLREYALIGDNDRSQDSGGVVLNSFVGNAPLNR